MDLRSKLGNLTGDFLWAVILIPILAISWLGFYTVARAVGVPPVFAAGMSAAFDGVALFAARIGLKHRRKGYSGYLARITVILFAALGAFVQTYHDRSASWIHGHAWIVWATVPIAACLAYELHLGWVHRKQLIAKGYAHPSAKSGFGPATWFLIGGTFGQYREVLRARRDFIAAGNLRRFELEDAAQPKLPPTPRPAPAPARPTQPVPASPVRVAGPAKPLRSVPSQRSTPQRAQGSRRAPMTEMQEAAEWAKAHGRKLGYRNRVPIDVLRDFRAEKSKAA